jgi:starch phosphorylase
MCGVTQNRFSSAATVSRAGCPAIRRTGSTGRNSAGDIRNPILDALLRDGDHYLHLADLKSYSEAHSRLGKLYTDQEAWSRQAILNIAASGKFSSDRTIAQYAQEIWHAEPCPVEC